MKYPKKSDILDPKLKITVTPNFRGLPNIHYCEFKGKFADNREKLVEEFRFWNQECEKILMTAPKDVKQHFIVDTSNSTSSIRDGYNMGKASEQLMDEIPLVSYPNMGSYVMVLSKSKGPGPYIITKVLSLVKMFSSKKSKYVHNDEDIYIVNDVEKGLEILKRL
jgi:hypothetical protein